MGTELTGGHEESVLCLVANNSSLLSGGEQGELCIWSLDGESRRKSKSVMVKVTLRLSVVHNRDLMRSTLHVVRLCISSTQDS